MRERVETSLPVRGRYAVERFTRCEGWNVHAVQIGAALVGPLRAQRLVQRQFFAFTRPQRFLNER